MSFRIVASCTPCVGPTADGVDQIRREAASDTSSCSGHLVMLMRRRSSTSSASDTVGTRNGRIAVAPATLASATSAIVVISASSAAREWLLLRSRRALEPRVQLHWPPQPLSPIIRTSLLLAALAARSLSRHPFADVGGTLSELDALRFVECQ